MVLYATVQKTGFRDIKKDRRSGPNRYMDLLLPLCTVIDEVSDFDSGGGNADHTGRDHIRSCIDQFHFLKSTIPNGTRFRLPLFSLVNSAEDLSGIFASILGDPGP